MKRLNLLLIIFLSIGAFTSFTSCTKEQEGSGPTEQLTTSDEALDDELEFILSGLAYGEDNFNARCGNISLSGNTYPLIITVDFGEGCADPYGKIRKGRMIIECADSLKAPYTERKIVFENYSVNGLKIEGFRNFKSLGNNGAGNPEFSCESDLAFETAIGKKLQRKHTGKKEWITGYGTASKEDDEFLITGNGLIVRPDGRTIRRTIATPVHIALGCEYPIAGEVVFKGATQETVLNFGERNCDEMATAINSSGAIVEVFMSQWKRRKPL